MRIFIATAALAIGAAGLTAPSSGAAASLTHAEDLATQTPIKHLVVVFQENASFDHYFGTYPRAANPPGEPAFVAQQDTPNVNNLLPTPLNGNRDLLATNPNLGKPFRLDRAQFVTCSQDHGYKVEQRAANGGLMNRFVQQTDKSTCDGLPEPVPSPQVMGYFDGNTVTALWNYAQHFALNDHAYATNYGPSTPGALNLVAGRTSGASPNNDKTVTEGVVYGDADPLYDVCSDPNKTAALTGPNVGDLLTQAGISWGWFQGGFRLNPMDDPAAACDKGHTNRAGFADEDYEPHHNPFQYFASTANAAHLPPTSVSAIGHDDQAKHQYDLTDFWSAAAQGDLPAVSFLKAAGYQDGHPGPANSNPLDEQDFLVDTLNRLQKLPEWSSTAVVLAWDDSDGWYDHQAPPNLHHSHNPAFDTLYGIGSSGDLTTLMCMAPSQKSLPLDDSSVFEMRCGFGERVPFLIVSPYVKADSVFHTDIDQTSILSFIEYNWELGRLGNGSFDATAGSLTNMFDFGQRREDTLLLNHVTGNPDGAPTITLAEDAASVEYSDSLPPITVSTSDPEGDALTVDAVGLPDGLTVTESEDGGWEVTGTDTAPGGVYHASIRVSDGVLSAEAPLEIVVEREKAQVGYTGDLLISTGDPTTGSVPVILRAHVAQEQDGAPGDLTRAAVLFELYAPSNTDGPPDATYRAEPTADGDASVDIGPLSTGTWTVSVRTDPTLGYFEAPTSDVVPVTVYAPTQGSFVTGGGWVHDPGYRDLPVPISTDDVATFGIDARLRKDGTASGNVTYVFTGANDNQYVVRSTGWQGGGLAITASSATIAGTCDVTVFDPAGEVVAVSSDDVFRLDVTDRAKIDTLALSVFTGDGTLYHRAGTPGNQLPLGGGQVVIHH